MAHSMSCGRPKKLPARRARSATATTCSSSAPAAAPARPAPARPRRLLALPGSARWAIALVGDGALDDRAVAIDVPGVGVALAGDQGGAQAVDGADHGDAAAAADRVGPERDAGHVGVRPSAAPAPPAAGAASEAVLAAVGDDALAEAGAPDGGYPRARRGRHEQEAVELPGERMLALRPRRTRTTARRPARHRDTIGSRALR